MPSLAHPAALHRLIAWGMLASTLGAMAAPAQPSPPQPTPVAHPAKAEPQGTALRPAPPKQDAAGMPDLPPQAPPRVIGEVIATKDMSADERRAAYRRMQAERKAAQSRDACDRQPAASAAGGCRPADAAAVKRTGSKP